MRDVFRVSMVVGAPPEPGEVDARVAELAGFAGGQVVEIGNPVQVPAQVLAEAAGVGVDDLPGREFSPSGDGWVPLNIDA